MYIHSYHPNDGQYTGSALAMPDPLDAENWLIPAFSTTATPPERERGQWPFFNRETGAWELRADWRSIVLYRCDNGETAEINAPGVTPEQVGLTQIARPSEEHVWKDGAWQIDPEKVLANARRAFLEQMDVRMERARQANWGKADAHSLGLLTPFEVGMYKAWSEYQIALVRLAQNADYTKEVAWPEEPKEAEVKATVDAEQAELQRQKDEQAAYEAKMAADLAEQARQQAEAEARAAAQQAADAATDAPAADADSSSAE
jgi:hypothetical protein